MIKEEMGKMITLVELMIKNNSSLSPLDLSSAEEFIRIWNGLEWELIDVLYNEENFTSGEDLALHLFGNNLFKKTENRLC